MLGNKRNHVVWTLNTSKSCIEGQLRHGRGRLNFVSRMFGCRR